MPLGKNSAPGNQPKQTDTTTTETNKQDTEPTLASGANPEGKTDVSTGPVGTDEQIEGSEHVLGDDPRRVSIGYHDSMTGAPVDQQGNFLDKSREGNSVPLHRVVADDWPNDREKLDDPQGREGNDAV